MSTEPYPDWLTKMPEEKLWAKLQARFDELRDLFSMRPETRAEAFGEKRPSAKGDKEEWIDTAPRWDGQRAWLLLPYIDALDQDAIVEQLEAGKELRDYISLCLQRRELSVSFLYAWGRFCTAAGLLERVYLSETNIGYQRSAKAGGDAKYEISNAHERWFAHYFLRLYKRGNREQAEKAIENFINGIADGNIAMPTEYELTWFEYFLDIDSKGGRSPLRDAFRERKFSVSTMKKLVAQGAEGIPPVDLEFPEP